MNFLISTVDSNFNAEKANISVADVILINQTFFSNKATENSNASVFTFFEKGLSRSRNHALDHAKDEICLLSDDDVVFVSDVKQIVESAFTNNPDADIITFRINTPSGKPFKNYQSSLHKHTIKSIMRVASIEIAFRLSSVRRAELRFDEQFGLGAKYPTGEENIFLADALSKGLKLHYVPKVIAIHPEISSGSNLNSGELFFAKGAMFARMFGKLGILTSFLFALKKRKYSQRTLLKVLGNMYLGWRSYLHEK